MRAMRWGESFKRSMEVCDNSTACTALLLSAHDCAFSYIFGGHYIRNDRRCHDDGRILVVALRQLHDRAAAKRLWSPSAGNSSLAARSVKTLVHVHEWIVLMLLFWGFVDCFVFARPCALSKSLRRQKRCATDSNRRCTASPCPCFDVDNKGRSKSNINWSRTTSHPKTSQHVGSRARTCWRPRGCFQSQKRNRHSS